MLFTPGNCFNWSVSNFTTTYSDAGPYGINSPGHASANTKGANTSMLVGIAEDCYGMEIVFSNGSTSTAARRNLVDILIDPAAGAGNAGSSWAVLIPNLYCSYASLGCGGYAYYFPIYLAKGTAIGSANQSLTATTSALTVGIRIYGKPTRPELLKCGTKVQAYGVTLASTSGTAISPGTNARGAYTATLGTSTFDQWFWQAGIGYNDTTIGGGTSISEATFIDVAASNDGGTTKTIVAQDIICNFSTTEQGGKAMLGSSNCWMVPSGATVYASAASTIAANTTPTVCAYGLGG